MQRRDAPCQRFQRTKADATAEQHIEAAADHAGGRHIFQLAIADALIDDADAAQALWLLAQRIEHEPVVGAVHAHLHQHAVGHAGRVEHGEILLRRDRRWRVAALRRERIIRRKPDHMRMRVDRAGRQLETPRRARMRIGPRDKRSTIGRERCRISGHLR